MASVKLTDVKKVYDNKVTAVHDFNLEIKDKEFVVFVGPSGCGFRRNGRPAPRAAAAFEPADNERRELLQWQV